MSSNSCCGLCGALVEDLSHLFRDCVEARLLWTRVVKEEKLDEFFTLDFQAWLVAWTGILPFTFLWNIWRQRNDRLVFSAGLITSEDIYHRSLRMIAEFGWASSMLRLNQQSSPLLTANVVRWEVSAAGWIKINTDGSRNISTGLASCGGVGRDSESRWCFGFAKGIGSCSCFEAEFWVYMRDLLQHGVYFTLESLLKQIAAKRMRHHVF
ncbi:hypothetical protein GQ457_03G031680 [Hibiscus cannabinus]